MLTDIEKIIFILFAIIAIGLSYTTFNKMFKAIGVGSQQIDWKRALLNFPKGIEVFISQRTLFKTRPVIGFIHALVAWGFTLYLVVNIVDLLYGFIPGFHFFPNYFIGKVYRLFVDIFTVLVLLGVVYFLVRRFIFKDNRLVINEPVMLNDLAKNKVDIVTIGQYLRPTRNHHPIERWVTPEEFERYRQIGLNKGFLEVVSGPMVRSSYRAERALEKNNAGL